jgi:hypothetical protein
MPRQEKGRRPVSAKFVAVLQAPLWGLHNAPVGKCSSYCAGHARVAYTSAGAADSGELQMSFGRTGR